LEYNECMGLKPGNRMVVDLSIRPLKQTGIIEEGFCGKKTELFHFFFNSFLW